MWNHTDEPCSNYFEVGLNGANRFADPNDYLLKRTPQIVALNNTWLLSDNSVLALRFGWTQFVDNSTMTIDFDPVDARLLADSSSARWPDRRAEVPARRADRVSQSTATADVRRDQPVVPHLQVDGANASFSKFVGTHTFKMGADYRQDWRLPAEPGQRERCFKFDKEFTSSTGLNQNSTTEGDAFASFLLGYPTADRARQSTMTLTTPLDIYANYYGGYWQDDWRLNSRSRSTTACASSTRTASARSTTTSRSASIPKATSALSSVIIPATVDPSGGTPARTVAGGLMYAGVDGNNTHQGNPPGVKWSPRVGAVYSLNTKTVLRGGYGLYWAPWNYPVPSSATSNYGQIGFTQNTVSPQTSGTPTVTLTNPFPNGLVAPRGNALGALSGVGTTISYVDQNRTAPRVQQYSADLQRELPARWPSPSATSARAAITCRSAARSTPWSTSTSSTRSTWRSARRC